MTPRSLEDLLSPAFSRQFDPVSTGRSRVRTIFASLRKQMFDIVQYTLSFSNFRNSLQVFEDIFPRFPEIFLKCASEQNARHSPLRPFGRDQFVTKTASPWRQKIGTMAGGCHGKKTWNLHQQTIWIEPRNHIYCIYTICKLHVRYTGMFNQHHGV